MKDIFEDIEVNVDPEAEVAGVSTPDPTPADTAAVPPIANVRPTLAHVAPAPIPVQVEVEEDGDEDEDDVINGSGGTRRTVVAAVVGVLALGGICGVGGHLVNKFGGLPGEPETPVATPLPTPVPAPEIPAVTDWVRRAKDVNETMTDEITTEINDANACAMLTVVCEDDWMANTFGHSTDPACPSPTVVMNSWGTDSLNGLTGDEFRKAIWKLPDVRIEGYIGQKVSSPVIQCTKGPFQYTIYLKRP